MDNFLLDLKKIVNLEESTLDFFPNVRCVLWHKFSEKKPKHNGSYLVITATDVDGYKYGWITTLPYYASVSMFNWDGDGEDTEIKVLYWANIQDVLPEELKEVEK